MLTEEFLVDSADSCSFRFEGLNAKAFALTLASEALASYVLESRAYSRITQEATHRSSLATV